MFNRGGPGQQKGFGFGGFTVGSSGSASAGRGTSMNSGSFNQLGGRPFGSGGSLNIGKRRVKSEEEYFDDDEETATPLEELEYQPAPDSPTLRRGSGFRAESPKSDISDDPLDAFMENIEGDLKKQEEADMHKAKKSKKGVRDDIEKEDEIEAYMRYMEENPNAGVVDEDDIIDYDDDGNPIRPEKKIIDPLPPIDHSDIDYKPFNKNFYEEHAEIKKLSADDVAALHKKLGIRVSGIMPLKPVSSFAHFGFDETLLKAVIKAGYTQPTPIQAQGVPIGMSGRDIIGIAKTGSGKTAAFLWPLLVHILDQKLASEGDGPVGLICAPTRELSQQIYQETKRFGKVYGLRVVCAYGGGSLYEQSKACEEGADIIVATPGRLIDLVKKKATTLQRVTYLVFDEADRMFDLGFEPQVRSIADHVRPDRQTMLFSATFRRRIERLARDILSDPVRVVQGDIGEANEDVTQIVKVMQPGPYKWNWLTARLVEFTTNGSVLIFVTRKTNSTELAENLKTRDFKVGLLHGDMSQHERNEVISAFKKKDMPILVATDVAARGLDIPHIRTVVNFDVARDIDTHTHRVGRTGRAGTKGTAYTLITTRDKDFSGHLVRNLEGANQYVPPELLELANQNTWFKKTRFKQQAAKKMNVGGRGLGFKEKTGVQERPIATGPLGSRFAAATSMQGVKNTYGPQSDRIHAMKSAFSAQYKSNFVSSTTPTPAMTPTNPSLDPHPLPDVAAPVHGMLHGSAASEQSLKNQEASRAYMHKSSDINAPDYIPEMSSPPPGRGEGRVEGRVEGRGEGRMEGWGEEQEAQPKKKKTRWDS